MNDKELKKEMAEVRAELKRMSEQSLKENQEKVSRIFKDRLGFEKDVSKLKKSEYDELIIFTKLKQQIELKEQIETYNSEKAKYKAELERVKSDASLSIDAKRKEVAEQKKAYEASKIAYKKTQQEIYTFEKSANISRTKMKSEEKGFFTDIIDTMSDDFFHRASAEIPLIGYFRKKYKDNKNKQDKDNAETSKIALDAERASITPDTSSLYEREGFGYGYQRRGAVVGSVGSVDQPVGKPIKPEKPTSDFADIELDEFGSTGFDELFDLLNKNHVQLLEMISTTSNKMITTIETKSNTVKIDLENTEAFGDFKKFADIYTEREELKKESKIHEKAKKDNPKDKKIQMSSDIELEKIDKRRAELRDESKSIAGRIKGRAGKPSISSLMGTQKEDAEIGQPKLIGEEETPRSEVILDEINNSIKEYFPIFVKHMENASIFQDAESKIGKKDSETLEDVGKLTKKINIGIDMATVGTIAAIGLVGWGIYELYQYLKDWDPLGLKPNPDTRKEIDQANQSNLDYEKEEDPVKKEELKIIKEEKTKIAIESMRKDMPIMTGIVDSFVSVKNFLTGDDKTNSDLKNNIKKDEVPVKDVQKDDTSDKVYKQNKQFENFVNKKEEQQLAKEKSDKEAMMKIQPPIVNVPAHEPTDMAKTESLLQKIVDEVKEMIKKDNIFK